MLRLFVVIISGVFIYIFEKSNFLLASSHIYYEMARKYDSSGECNDLFNEMKAIEYYKMAANMGHYFSIYILEKRYGFSKKHRLDRNKRFFRFIDTASKFGFEEAEKELINNPIVDGKELIAKDYSLLREAKCKLEYRNQVLEEKKQ